MAGRPQRSPNWQFLRSFRYRIGEYALRWFVAALRWIPYRWIVPFTSQMAWLTFKLLWKYRNRMEENVEKALGEQIADAAERKWLVWRAWNNFAQGVMDTMVAMHLSKKGIIEFIALEGEAHLKHALAKGKGVIALSAHLGAFTLIGPRLAAAGYSFSAVVKHPADERFARVMTDLRTRVGVDTISARPRQEAVRGILKALRKNSVVLVIADEFKSGGVNLNFMGQTAAAPRGPASLALRTGAVTLPVFAPRTADGSVAVQIGMEIEPVRHADVEESVAETTRLFARYMEDVIRRFPDQWNWLGFPRPRRPSRTESLRRHRGAKKTAATESALEINNEGRQGQKEYRDGRHAAEAKRSSRMS
jgi:KDO2-lipid IV(A) lauroyltransferase